MKFLKDLELAHEWGLFQRKKGNDSSAFFFDDEPIEGILYGKDPKGPTPANLYFPAMEFLQEMKRFYSKGQLQDVLDKADALSRKGYPLSKTICFELDGGIEKSEPELKSFVEILGRSREWHARNHLFL